MKYFVCVIFLYFVSFLSVFPVWQRNIVNYSRSIYQAGFQNWMVTQAENGWMYFANSKGLLEFDGVYWNLYPVNNKIMRVVKIIDDKIYIGANTEFGYFKKNSIGELIYHSLSENIETNWGAIWNITELGEQIYFLTDYNIFIYSKEDGKIINIPTTIKVDYCSKVIQDRLYIASTDGLFFLNEQNDLELTPSTELFKGMKIVGLQGYKDGIVVTTARGGLYFVSKNKSERISTIANTFIQRNQLFCSAISGSKMVLGSVQNGALLFDLESSDYIETFNLNNGLNNNTVLNVIFDKDQSLWLGLDKGIAYIDLNSPIKPMFAVNSPIGTGYCSILYNNQLYLGTNQGLYKVDKAGNYQMIKDSEGQIWSLKIIGNQLFSSGDNGIMVISPNSIYKIPLMGVWGIEPLSANENAILAGTYSGFSVLTREGGQWRYTRNVSGFSNSVRGFMEDDTPNNFWTANATGDVYKVSIDFQSGKVTGQKTYKLGNSKVGENTFFRKIQNNLVICGEDGLYQYSRISDEFIPYPQLESTLDGHKYYDFLDIDHSGNIWFVSDKKLKMKASSNGDYSSGIITWGLENDLIDNSENVTLLDPTSAIVSVDKAFVNINLAELQNSKDEVNIWIRKLVANDSIINYDNTQVESIEIPYTSNTVKIYFSSTLYPYAWDVLYSYRLKNMETDWSSPTWLIMKEYTNLPEGDYTFEVKAILSDSEDSGPITSISFTILPPWYRSTWAYFFYTIVFVVFIVILYAKTIKKQKRIIKEKAREMETQSKLYEQERILKNKEIYELQNENLRTNLNYKTQELTGYILNLIRKNEMLEEVKKGVVSISKALDENKEHSTIRQRVLRLVTQINNNIEHDKDFDMFQSNFNLLHKDFFKLLEEKYPGLTRNDKILCAYLKMNLSSKEIAPLLNISIRGVEVNRYRLRKKMNLERDINLVEFLQSLSIANSPDEAASKL